jgi:DNA repair exonuclease SbcCD ATPase subunit
MRHAIPEELQNFQRRQHANGQRQTDIYCPLGHAYVKAGKGEAEKLRESLERERERAARMAAERDQAQASARSYKGVATKARKRAAAAVCPCCNRSFVQLRRHMETQHPDYDPAVA